MISPERVSTSAQFHHTYLLRCLLFAVESVERRALVFDHLDNVFSARLELVNKRLQLRERLGRRCIPQKNRMSGVVSLHPWWRLQIWLPAQYVEFQRGLHLGPSDVHPVVQADPLPKHQQLPTRGCS